MTIASYTLMVLFVLWLAVKAGFEANKDYLVSQAGSWFFTLVFATMIILLWIFK